MTEVHAGRCLCGAVSFEARGKPLRTLHCHCPSCRKATGAAFATFVDFKAKNVVFKGEAYKTYASSPGAKRGFCRECGTSLSFFGEQWPGEVDLHIGAFDHPERFTPERHLYCSTAMPWLRFDDHLPAIQKFSDS